MNIKLILVAMLVGSQAMAGLPPTTIKGQSDASAATTFGLQVPLSQSTRTGGTTALIETGNLNLLINPGFEGTTYSTGWTSVAGTPSKDTASQFGGLADMSISLTAISGSVETQSVTPTQALAGVNMEAALRVKTTQTNVQVCALAAGTQIGCNDVPATGQWSLVPVNFIMPSSGSVGVQLYTKAAVTGTVQIDDGYLGPARNVTSINQATYVGSVTMTGAASCNYTTTSSSYANFSANASCNASTATGSLAAPATKIPAFNGTLAAGTYLVNVNANIADNTTSAIDACRVSTGSVGSSDWTYLFRDSATGSYSPTQSLVLTLTAPYSGDVNFQCKTSGGGTLSVANALTAMQLRFDVYRYPGSNDQVYRSELSAISWNAYFDVASGWTTTSTTFADLSAGATITSTTLSSRNLSCSVFGTAAGITCAFPRSGIYQVCANGNILNSAGTGGSIAVRLVDSSGAIVHPGTSGNSAGTIPFAMCGNYSVSAAGNASFKIQSAVGGGGTASLSNVFTGQHQLTWSVLAIDSTLAAPVLVGTTQALRTQTAAGPATLTFADSVLVVNQTSGAAITVNLPANPIAGQTHTVKDGKGDAGTNNITVTPASGNIDGLSTYVIRVNYQSATFVYNGTQWNVM